MPSAFAVLRLIRKSNLVACWTGMSAGFSPLRMRPEADLAKQLFNVRSVAHQPADIDRSAIPIDRRNRVACRKRSELYAKGGVLRAGVDQQRIDSLLRKAREGHFKIAKCGGSIDDVDMYPDRRTRGLQVCDVGRAGRTVVGFKQ